MVKVCSNISLNDLRDILKKEVKEITLNDLYQLSFNFFDETKYLPDEYEKNYSETILNVNIKRINKLKNDNDNYTGILCDKDIFLINELLKKNDKTDYILNITVIYATYLLKEPIHVLRTKFPGHKELEFDGKYYYCPIKKYHINNSNAICKYCIAKIIEE